MFHPLGTDLSKLTLEELYKKNDELLTRYNQAYRIGPYGVLPQLQMLMADYQNEIQLRNQKQLEELEKNTKLKGIIDIK